jgi:putative ABC transport system permease protein
MNLLWRLSFRNLFRNRRRSLTTGIAIVAGFIGLSLLGAYIFRVQKGLQASTVYINLQGHLQIHKKDSLDKFSLSPKKYLIDTQLDQKLQSLLQKYSKQIEFQSRFLSGSGLLVAEKISQPFLAVGFEREVLLKTLHHPSVEQWAKSWSKLSLESLTPEMLNNHSLISITPRIAEIINRPKDLHNLKAEQRSVQLVTRTFDNDLNAVDADLGLMHTTGVALAEDTSIRVSLKLLQDLLATDGYQYQVLFLTDEGKAFDLKKQLQMDFQLQGLPLEVIHFTESAAGEFYVGSMNFLYVMGTFFVFLICGMVALSIVNSLTLGILERTSELGTLKALGFSSSQIVGLFVRESIWLSGLSIGVGLLLSQIVARFVNAANIRFTPPGIEGDIQFLLDPEVFLFIILAFMLFAIAVLTSYRVSKRKMKRTAIELLTESGV